MKYLLPAILLALFLTGCEQYFRITDPASGRVYIGQKGFGSGLGGNGVRMSGFNGAIRFKEVGTGKWVTLQSSEVEPLTKEEAEIYAAKKE